jgi:hypothetical protein
MSFTRRPLLRYMPFIAHPSIPASPANSKFPSHGPNSLAKTTRMPNHWRTVASLCLALLDLVYADAGCYYAANARAASIIIPCSSAPGFSTCCQMGDLCLSNNACWNPQYNITYLYGCTDPSFTDNTCPYKCGVTYAGSMYTSSVVQSSI